MPIKPRGPKTQIRSKKDTNRKEITELKAENAELKRTVVRLRKEVERGGQDSRDIDSLPDVLNEEDDANRCEFCDSSNMKTFRNLAGKAILICNDCTKRRFAPPLD